MCRGFIAQLPFFFSAGCYKRVQCDCREREEEDEANESRGPVGDEECGEEVWRQCGGEQVV